MSNQTALQPSESKPANEPLFVEAEKLLDQMRELSQSIGRRAYEFFETRGREFGHDMEDWFRAESELLRRVPVAISETDKQLTVRGTFSLVGNVERSPKTTISRSATIKLWPIMANSAEVLPRQMAK